MQPPSAVGVVAMQLILGLDGLRVAAGVHSTAALGVVCDWRKNLLTQNIAETRFYKSVNEMRWGLG